MKLKLILISIMLLVLSVVPMIYMGKIDPMAFFGSTGSMASSEFKKLAAKAPKNLTSVVSNQKVQVYKWRDESGVLQFSNTPPVGNKNAEQVILDPNSNLMQAVKIPVKESSESASIAGNQASKATAQTKLDSPYSIKGMKKTMKDARNVENMLQQRHEQQQNVLNKL